MTDTTPLGEIEVTADETDLVDEPKFDDAPQDDEATEADA